MKLNLIYDRIRWEEKEILKSCSKHNVDYTQIDAKSIAAKLGGTDSFLRNNETSNDNSDIFNNSINLQRCLSHFRGYHITCYIENQGGLVINNSNTMNICGNKYLTSSLLRSNNISIPKTICAFSFDSAVSAMNELNYPLVIKPVIGSWGRGIELIQNENDGMNALNARKERNQLYDNIYYLQEFIGNKLTSNGDILNSRDLRILVVGDKPIVAYYRYSKSGQWKNNVALGSITEHCEITKEMEELTERVINTIGEGIFAIDLLEIQNGLVVLELNNNMEFKGAQTTTSVNIADEIVKYLIKKNNS